MEAISVFDIFKIGVGPSSSHTMGPWRAAARFLQRCERERGLEGLQGLQVDLYGSLAKTGRGHGTDTAVLLGLAGWDPTTCDTAAISGTVAAIQREGRLALAGRHSVAFTPTRDIVFHFDQSLPRHPNALTFTARYGGTPPLQATYYSVGGGFVVEDGEEESAVGATPLPHPIVTAADLIRHCREQNLTIPEVVRRNEHTWRDEGAVVSGLTLLWETMAHCALRGCRSGGTLPGGLEVMRRAAGLHARLAGTTPGDDADLGEWIASLRALPDRGFTDTLKWVSCFALAVNEENAAFGRVVTAPTNGAAGVIPAVLLYAVCFSGADLDQVHDFLLTAGEVGSIFKKGATLSAAMGGCQAEIGVSSAMAAAGLTQISGGSPEQVLMAAEIAMEHHLGLTCDPVGGLVQIPCIERNSMGAVKAITACAIALESDPARSRVSLDAVIRTMWQTALDMNGKYKETSEGGLAVNIPVSLSEC